jgi:predicted nuclease of predicted toxin-antitoxin system
LNFVIDENMPRSLGPQIADMGFAVEDVRDIGLHGRPDTEVFDAAVARDAIVITRDRGFIFERHWPDGFTAGVIFVNLPSTTSATVINARIVTLLRQRRPESLLGAVTILEPHRALSRTARRRP